MKTIPLKARSVAATLLSVLTALAPAQSHAAEIEKLSYESAKVQLTGVIVEESFGPDAAPRDRGRRVWILRLDHPIAVAGNPGDLVNTEETDVKEVCLVVDPEKNPVPKEAFGKTRFVVSGTLFHAITTHHLRPVMLNVSTLKAAGPDKK